MNTLIALALCTVPAPAGVISGSYVEARTCDVYTGPCVANAEVNERGKQATVAWKIERGTQNGADLAGLSVVAVLDARATLGDPYQTPGPARTALFLDERASAAARSALRDFALTQLAAYQPVVVGERAAAIELDIGCCKGEGCAALEIAGEVKLATRCMHSDDHVCGNESTFYPPLTSGVDAIAALASENAYEGTLFQKTWNDRDSRGAFVGDFRVVAPAVAPQPAVCPLGAMRMHLFSSGAAEYELTRAPAASGDDAAALPKEIPEAFARLLDPQCFSLKADGEALCDLWLVQALELAAEPVAKSRIAFGQLELGSFVGVLRANGHGTDYRDAKIERGLYAMRYFVQPENGDHLGTAEMRDFLMLTKFAEDKSPAPIADEDTIYEMSVTASTTDHALVCYLVAPEGEVAESGRVYKHAKRAEWIVDLAVPTRSPAAKPDGDPAKAAGPVRLGLVLVGVSEHS